VRICLVYDCLYPWTVGGAERRMRVLAEALAAAGHTVTYLTRKQWPDDAPPQLPGIEVIAVSREEPLYGPDGNRTIGEPLRFGHGVLNHLLRHGRDYDVVHTASFPYFSLLAAGAVRPPRRFRLVVDWHEVWTRGYWREYLGPVGGEIGWRVQRLCLRLPQQAFCFSRLHARRLLEEGVAASVLEGQYAGTAESEEPAPAEPVVVFAGRHIPEKRVPAIVPAIVLARRELPEVRAELYGDGPDRGEVLRRIAESGLDGAVVAPGFVEFERVDRALRTALCLLLPSSREGYGLVVLEAAARGTPSVLVQGPDNAATELVEEGVNGVLAPSPSAEDLAAAIVRVERAGYALRESTADWFRRNADRLSLARSLEVVTKTYAGV
jgi:glycosyltransferase involved in cell wall biosynthesis